MQKPCTDCQVVFNARQCRQVRCPACQNKHRNSHLRLKYNKVCVDCNQEFKTGNMRAPRCGHCRYNANCQSCGTEFYREVSTQRFCSHECRMRAKKDFYYGGAYSEVMERDNNQCQKCDAKDELCVHHIDHSGSHNVEQFKANNELSNLVVLCSKCHKNIHVFTYKILADKYHNDVLQLAEQFLKGARP